MATRHAENPQLWMPTSVLYAVGYLHFLVHLETPSLTFCAGLLLLLLLSVRLLALAVRHRGVHYYSRVREGGGGGGGCDGGVWRCGVRHLLSWLRLQMRRSKNVTPGCDVRASCGSAQTQRGKKEGEGDTSRSCGSSCAKERAVKMTQYRKLGGVDFKTNAQPSAEQNLKSPP